MKQRYLATLIAVICAGAALPVLAQNVPVTSSISDTSSIAKTMSSYNTVAPLVKLGATPASMTATTSANANANGLFKNGGTNTGTGQSGGLEPYERTVVTSGSGNGIVDGVYGSTSGGTSFSQGVSSQGGWASSGIEPYERTVVTGGPGSIVDGVYGSSQSAAGDRVSGYFTDGLKKATGSAMSGLSGSMPAGMGNGISGLSGLAGMAGGTAGSGFTLENMARVAQGVGGVVGGQFGTAAVGLGGAVGAYNNCSDITIGCAQGIATMATGLYATLHPKSATAQTLARVTGVVAATNMVSNLTGMPNTRIIGETDAQFNARVDQMQKNFINGDSIYKKNPMPGTGSTVYNGPSADAAAYTGGAVSSNNVYQLPDGTTFAAGNQPVPMTNVNNPGLASWLQNQPVNAVGGSVDVVPMNPGVVQPGSNTGFDAWMRNQPVSIPVSQDSNPISLSQPARATTTMIAPNLSASNPVLQQLAAQQSASMVSAMQAQRNAVAQYGAGSPEAKGMMDSVNMLSAVSGRQYAQAVELEKARAANQNTALLAQQQFSANTAANANLYASVAPYSVEPTVPQSFIAVSNNIPVTEPVSYTTPGIKTSPWGVPVTGTADDNNPPGAD